MSLTNEMLKNLDRQKSKNGDALVHDLHAPNISSQLPKHILLVLLFILVFVIIYDVFYWRTTHNATQTPRIILPQKIFIPAKPTAPTELPVLATAPPLPPIITPGKNIELGPQDLAVKTPVQEPLEDKLSEDYQAALNLIAQNKTQAAIDKLQQLLTIFPDYQDARVSLATIFLQQQAYDQASETLKKGLTLQPNNIPLLSLYGRTLISQEQYAAALQVLLPQADKAGDDPDYLSLLASAYQHTGKANEAMALYEKLLTNDPNNGRWLAALGICLEQAGRPNEAVLIYQKAQHGANLPIELQAFVSGRVTALGGKP